MCSCKMQTFLIETVVIHKHLHGFLKIFLEIFANKNRQTHGTVTDLPLPLRHDPASNKHYSNKTITQTRFTAFSERRFFVALTATPRNATPRPFTPLHMLLETSGR